MQFASTRFSWRMMFLKLALSSSMCATNLEAIGKKIKNLESNLVFEEPPPNPPQKTKTKNKCKMASQNKMADFPLSPQEWFLESFFGGSTHDRPSTKFHDVKLNWFQ